MSEVKWIKIASDIFEDEKIKLITGKNADSIILIWFKLLCLAGRLNNRGIFIIGKKPYDIKMFADAFGRKESLVKEAFQTFDELEMIELIDGIVTLPNWEKHQASDALERKRERDKEYKAKIRENKKSVVGQSSDSRKKVVECRQTDEEIDVDIYKEKESEKEKESALPPKHKYGEYKNVLLTDEELAKIKAEYPTDYEGMIENLSSYLATKNVSYKSHYAVIRRWAREDVKKSEVKKKPFYVANNPFLQHQQSDTDYAALEESLIGK